MVGCRADGVPGVMTHAVDQMLAHIEGDQARKYMLRAS
jgi:hypothetical protein